MIEPGDTTHNIAVVHPTQIGQLRIATTVRVAVIPSQIVQTCDRVQVNHEPVLWTAAVSALDLGI
jgi:hypothetical protein